MRALVWKPSFSACRRCCASQPAPPPAAMIQAYRRKIEGSTLDEAKRAQYLKELEEGFKGYTYHEK